MSALNSAKPRHFCLCICECEAEALPDSQFCQVCRDEIAGGPLHEARDAARIEHPRELKAEYPCGCFYLFESLSSGTALIQAWSHCAEHEARLQAFLQREHGGA